MNWRSFLLSGVLASGLAVQVPRAAADPLPRAGRFLYVEHRDHDHDHAWRRRDAWREHAEHRRHDWDDGWRRRHDHDGDGDDGYGRTARRGWSYRENERAPWWRGHDGYGRYEGAYGRHSGDDRYAKLMDRMSYDRAKIAENEGTGRHRKALQWYKDDLRNAQRDLRDYRDR